MQNLREKETQLLGKMLTLTNSGSALNSTDFNDQWKVLIYDQDCRDIISPLMNVGALRQKGVTLHMLIHTEREAVPDAPAVYFVRPTEANVKRIAEDCAKQLYRTVYINFVTRIDRPLMEKLAQELVATNSVSMVSKIYDQYLDLVTIEPNLFTLNIKDSFMLYSEASLSESQIRKYMNRVATGMLSMVRVLGSLPVIRSPTNCAAEMLAHELCGMLRENISAKGPAPSLFEECLVNDRSRPLLLIFDRACDLFPVLQHSSLYQPSISDCLDFKLNRVSIEMKDKEGKNPPKKLTYDLNTHVDTFLHQYAGALYPDVLAASEKELKDVSQREAALRRTDAYNNDSLEAKGRDLSEAIESLPELMNKKKNVDAHTNILHAIMEKFQLRATPYYADLEQEVLTSGGRPDRAPVLAMLRDGTKGTLLDKARLLAIVVVASEPSYNSKANNEELDSALAAGCLAMTTPPPQASIDRALSAIAYLRRQQTFSSPISGGGNKGNAQAAIFSNLLNSAINRVQQAFTTFTPYYVTRVVDNLSEGKTCPESEGFTYLDPRTNNNSLPATAAGHKYSDVIVFVLGGGGYAEYFNLQELLKGKSSASGHVLRSIMYGTSEMVNGDGFFDQLERLGAPAVSISVAGAK